MVAMSVELADGEIIVRPYRPEDIPALFEAARSSIPELSQWMPWCHPDYSIAETKSFILSRPEQWAKGAEYGFGVFSREDGRFLGGVGMNFINRVHQMIRDRALLAVRRDGVLRIPTELVSGRAVLKHLPGVLTLLHDAGYNDEEAFRWLYTPDDSLPGTPAVALCGDRATEVKRRAQALGF